MKVGKLYKILVSYWRDGKYYAFGLTCSNDNKNYKHTEIEFNSKEEAIGLVIKKFDNLEFDRNHQKYAVLIRDELILLYDTDFLEEIKLKK